MTSHETTIAPAPDRSPIFGLSNRYIDRLAALDPIAATNLGVPGYDDQFPDFTLAGGQAHASLIRATLNELAALSPIDEIDRIAGAVFAERLESSLSLHESMETPRIMSALWSPASSVRQIFEIMDSLSSEGISNITARLNLVSKAHQQWRESLEELAALGLTSARRQALAVANQAESYATNGYVAFAQKIDQESKYPALHAAAATAARGSGELATWLRTEYAPIADPNDAYGEARYAPWARNYTGAELDLRDTYEWGLEDLAAINDRMWRVSERIAPDAKSLREVAEHLDADPKYAIHGTDALLKYLRDFTDASIEKLNGTHFDIDERIKFCDVRLAPEGSAAAQYYMPPSEDLSRPGTTWYPTLGKTDFTSWRNDSTWYHEAVPGHHLQCATVVIQRERLSRFQRTEGWTSGYGEGWALYAERLMDELGAYLDPGAEMGFLSGQALRAARVVVDIGMHLGYPDPTGEVWNASSARNWLIERALIEPEFAASEVDRYLGIPGQAISYKVGERVWMKVRQSAKTRLGSDFDLKSFHAHALRLGPMGLDPFESEMGSWRP